MRINTSTPMIRRVATDGTIYVSNLSRAQAARIRALVAEGETPIRAINRVVETTSPGTPWEIR